MLEPFDLITNFFEVQYARNKQHTERFQRAIREGTYPPLDMTSRRKRAKKARGQVKLASPVEGEVVMAKSFVDCRTGKRTTLIDHS